MDERVIPASMQAQYDNFHFAPAVKVGDLLLCSGQIGTDETGACPEDAETQFRLAFEGLRTILEEAGGTLADVVEMTTYHTDMGSLGTFLKVKDEFVAEPYPAWTAIAVPNSRCPAHSSRSGLRRTSADVQRSPRPLRWGCGGAGGTR